MRTVAAFFIVMCLVAETLAAPEPAAIKAFETVVNQEMADSKTPGAAFVIVQDGRIVYSHGFGKASAEQETPVTSSTVFRLGSTTKMMTAAALMKLVDAGKLSLDAPVTTYVKNLDIPFAKVSLRRTLSHSAGMCESSPVVMSNDDDALKREVESWHGKQRFFAEPGAIFSYSGPSYYLSGFTLETLTGKPYADAMAETLLGPAGMTSSTLRPLIALTFPLAQGHMLGKNGPEVVRPMAENVAMYPGGSMFSTADDLGRFMIALLSPDGQAFTKSAADLFFSQQVTLPAREEHKGKFGYAFGTVTYEIGGTRIFEHGGVRKGYGSFIRMVPSKHIGIALMTNLNGVTLRRSLAEATRVFAGLNEDRDQPPAPMPVDPAELKQVVGKYHQCDFTWEFAQKDGKLFRTFDGRNSELHRVGKFYYTDDDGEDTIFIAGAAGDVEFMHSDLVSAKKEK